jgi:hypothetical protein
MPTNYCKKKVMVVRKKVDKFANVDNLLQEAGIDLCAIATIL